MKVIKIKSISLGDKDQFQASSYPEAGCFMVQENIFNIFFINKGQVWSMPIEYIPIEEAKEQEGLTNDFILELIAVSQNPEIIIGLKK